MRSELDVRIERQPDYTTCGPTALQAIYRYYGDPIDLATVIGEVVWGDLTPEPHGTKYCASVFRLIGAIFLGVESDDGNLPEIRPKGWKRRRDGAAS